MQAREQQLGRIQAALRGQRVAPDRITEPVAKWIPKAELKSPGP